MSKILKISPIEGDGCGITCEFCGLCREQATGTEDGVTNDNGWWCADCVMHGHKRTVAQDDWSFFARDYPAFAYELKRLRKFITRPIP